MYFTCFTLARVSLCADSVQFVNEDDGRTLLLCELECVADHLSTIADKHLYELGTGQLQEGRLCLGGARSRHQSLTGAGGTVHQ